ncbi:MAG: hypothetical protein GY748_25880 [Planctomycetaceae bacterium]|nr:hypothetical protein [Planctomycetaceae bacterium]MCP4478045.1 hypothetical protein [Planctomycetaceae bacterium]
MSNAAFQRRLKGNIKYLSVDASTAGSSGGMDSTARASPVDWNAAQIYLEIDDP